MAKKKRFNVKGNRDQMPLYYQVKIGLITQMPL